MSLSQGSALILMLSILLSACSKDDKSSGSSSGPGATNPFAREGTQHIGGGEIKDSTPEQVNKAIDLAIQMANEPNIPHNIFANFIWDNAIKDERLGKMVVVIFPDYNKPSDKKQWGRGYKSPALRAFLKNHIDRLPSGDCPFAKDETTADASVSEHSLNAKICFSVGNLTEIPPSIILREVLGLVLHEACHMSGCKEDDANYWQEKFTKYFEARIGDINIDDFTHPARGNINIASQFLENALSIAENDPNSRYVYSAMGAVAGQLMSAPYSDDPIAIKLKANPKHPQFIDHYWLQINLVIQKVQAAFQIPNPAFTFSLLEVGYEFNLIEESKVLDKLKEIDRDMTCLREILDALSSGSLRKECYTKPMGPLERYIALPHNNGDPINPFMEEDEPVQEAKN